MSKPTVKKKKNEEMFSKLEIDNAIVSGDTRFFQELKKNGGTVIYHEVFKKSCEVGNIELLQFFADWFGDLVPTNISRFGNLELLKYFIKKGCDKDLEVYFAAREGQYENVKFLIDAGADLNKIMGIDTPLCAAIDYGHIEIVELLLLNGANPNITNDRQTPVIRAVYSGNEDLLKKLVSLGANLGFSEDPYTCPFFEVDMLTDAQSLKDLGFKIEAYDKDNESPLHYAVFKGSFELVKFYVSNGLDFLQESIRGESPLSLTIARYDEDFPPLKEHKLQMFEFFIERLDDKTKARNLWKRIVDNGSIDSKICENFLKKRIPLPIDFDVDDKELVKCVFNSIFEFKATTVLLCAKEKNPDSPLYKKNLPLDLFKIIFFMVKKACFENEWDVFVK